ncbi:MAG TPA: hypothetical protein VKV04_25305 [Verrucomicrobiae bacterium]|nr:hypothetical protein [Verrucomicrobiae bacterium]
MTKQDFILKLQAWNQNTRRDLAAFLAAFFLSCGVLCVWERHQEAHGGPGWITPCGLALVIALPLFSALFLYDRRVRRFGCACQSCGKQLFGGQNGGGHAKIVIATGNCCFCGAKVCD